MNKSIELFDNDVTIDSREIAELTNKNHSDVCRDIRNQLKQMNIGESNFASSYISQQNKSVNCFRLNHEQTMILISGYSIPLRAKIIRRWSELEKKNKPQLPTHIEALRLYADQLEKTELLQIEAEANKPKIEYYENVLDSGTSFTTTQIADELDMSCQKLNKILVVEGIIYRQSKSFHLYAKYKGHGFSDIRTAPYIDSKGNRQTKHYLVWTEKGRQLIHNKVKELIND